MGKRKKKTVLKNRKRFNGRLSQKKLKRGLPGARN